MHTSGLVGNCVSGTVSLESLSHMVGEAEKTNTGISVKTIVSADEGSGVLHINLVG